MVVEVEVQGGVVVGGILCEDRPASCFVGGTLNSVLIHGWAEVPSKPRTPFLRAPSAQPNPYPHLQDPHSDIPLVMGSQRMDFWEHI